ncbi:hypothetical protein N0V90_008960 [Kalmusia sp. IMI 367209]|nr:hypothetical protein N0V90_008960 [Kalmusia sp. IMI 367209]
MHIFAKPQIPGSASVSSKFPAAKEHLSMGFFLKYATILTEPGFIIRSAAKGINGLCFGASFTYHFPTRHMYAFVHYYESPPYVDMQLATENEAFRETPFLMPLFLLQVDMEQRYQFTTSAHSTLFALEVQAGIRDSQKNQSFIDFSALSKNISFFIGNLALVTWACKTMRRQLEFMGEVAQKYHEQALANGVEIEEADRVRLLLENNLKELRAQALIQTVYSGIAQRDAALSQNAAMAAARDSTIMRIIAAITMLFLPATTVAAVFRKL